MPFIEDLVYSIDARLQALSREIVSLEEARSALISNGRPQPQARRARPRKARRTSRRTPPKATKRAKPNSVLLADQTERLLASTNGLSTAALAKQAGANHDQVLALLRDLEKARRVRRSGQRRATRWHAITDEDRIRERAAELAARSRRRSS
jgi:hypothetical protein